VPNPSSASFDVTRYIATVEADVEKRTIEARETIAITALEEGLSEVVFDCGDLVVDSVSDGSGSAQFEQHDRR
jgi:hypothetical protein